MAEKLLNKERVIYNNYDLYKDFDNCKQNMIENGCDDPTDNEVWEQLYFEDQLAWDAEKEMLDDFFKNVNYIGFFGEIGRWNGVYKGGKIDTNFWKLFDDAITDCDYIKIYDENGHLYLDCSHHDGTCHFEIKIITEKGYNYLQNWEYNWDDKRTQEYVHNQIYKRYSRLPHYANKVFGCPKREYEKQSKTGFIRILNNQARSFY